MLWQATGAPLPSGGWGHAHSSDSQPKPALPTGCRGRAHRSGTRPVLPANWGPRRSSAQLEPPYPTGGPGRMLRSGTAGASPAHRGAWIEHVALARRWSSPCPPGAGDACVWYQMSTRTLCGWRLISIIKGWLLVHDWYSFTLGICFLCISGYVDSKEVSGVGARGPSPPAHRGPRSRAPEFPCQPAAGDAPASLARGWSPPAEKTVFIKHQPKLYLVDVWYQMSTKTLSGWCLISNVNQNCIPVDVWYQTSIRTLSGWCLISIIKRVATGSWLIFIYSRYMFSLNFRVCRFKKGIRGLGRAGRAPSPPGAGVARAALERSRSPLLKKQFSSNINQNCIWLMFDIKCQPKLYLVDVWYQTSTGTVSGWCLISNVNQNSIWLMFDIKCQPELDPGWCLISNVNQNSFSLMFDINHQAGGYWFMIDIHLL